MNDNESFVLVELSDTGYEDLQSLYNYIYNEAEKARAEIVKEKYTKRKFRIFPYFDENYFWGNWEHLKFWMFLDLLDERNYSRPYLFYRKKFIILEDIIRMLKMGRILYLTPEYSMYLNEFLNYNYRSKND